jgi:hypothetical protein
MKTCKKERKVGPVLVLYLFSLELSKLSSFPVTFLAVYWFACIVFG